MKVIPCRWTENRKGAGTDSGKSGARNLESESIGSRAESTGGCVKVEDSRRNKTEQCAKYIYSRECLSCTEFFVGSGASGEIETGGDVVSFTLLLFSV